MAIVSQDWNEILLDLSVPGLQVNASTDLEAAVVPFAGTIRGIIARLDTAPSAGGTQVTDIKLNGTTIFSGATKINFASGSKSPTYGAFTVNPTVVAKGDVLTVHTPTAGATVGKNLAIQVCIRRNRASAYQTATDSISENSDAI